MPAPQRVKWSVLKRHGGAGDIWVETGTYLGATTAFLAASAKHVYSIEPEPDLARRARERFAGNERVTILEGLSEDRLPELLHDLRGSVSFWLDGHYSEGLTFQGPTDTPIRFELSLIEKSLTRLDSVKVLVDDVRCFDPHSELYSDYPSPSFLVKWADANEMPWTIEHDIFVARR